jgi:hypothetical protein
MKNNKMSCKLIIPSNLISSTVSSNVDADNNYAVTLQVKFSFIEDVEQWFIDHIGKSPFIMLNRRDFEPSEYWIKLPDQEIVDAFKLAWF